MKVPPERSAASPAEGAALRNVNEQEPTDAAEMRIVLEPAGKSLLLPELTVEVALHAGRPFGGVPAVVAVTPLTDAALTDTAQQRWHQDPVAQGPDTPGPDVPGGPASRPGGDLCSSPLGPQSGS